jgi:hypothetical protein
MKIYRSERDGVTVWRLSGVVEREDAKKLVRAMKGRAKRLRGCHVLDFTDVGHVDYHAFRVLEDSIRADKDVLLSGLSDYVLDIFAFSRRKRHLAVFSDWRKALQHIKLDRGKMISLPAHGFAGFK